MLSYVRGQARDGEDMDMEPNRIAKIDKNVSPNGKPLSELAGAAKYLRASKNS
jgi:hypothetical protein